MITHTITQLQVVFLKPNHLALEASVHAATCLNSTYRTLEQSVNSWQNYRGLIYDSATRSDNTLSISRLPLIGRIKQDYVVAVAKSISGLAHDNYEYVINIRVIVQRVRKIEKETCERGPERCTRYSLRRFCTCIRCNRNYPCVRVLHTCSSITALIARFAMLIVLFKRRLFRPDSSYFSSRVRKLMLMRDISMYAAHYVSLLCIQLWLQFYELLVRIGTQRQIIRSVRFIEMYNFSFALNRPFVALHSNCYYLCTLFPSHTNF